MLSRSTTDRPDDISGAQVKVIYALPKESSDRGLDVTTLWPYSIASLNGWLKREIGRQLIFDTYGGELDIQFVRLPRTEATYRASGGSILWMIEFDLTTAGAVQPGKNYLVYFDGTNQAGICGESELPGTVSAVYLKSCDGPNAGGVGSHPTWYDLITFHELFHALGARHIPDPTTTVYDQEWLEQVCDLMFSRAGNACGRTYVDIRNRFYYSPTSLPDPPDPYRTNVYGSPLLTAP